MTSMGIQPSIRELLEQAGATPPRNGRGKWTCPKCGQPTLSVNADKQVFNCHHAGCDFHGGIGTLRKTLGIEREWLPSAEYRALRRRRERASEAACRLYSMAHQRQLELREELRSLGRLEILAHECGPTEEAWGLLADVYSRRPALEAELNMLESDDPRAVLESLGKSAE